MHTSSLVSVIIPAYNHENYVQGTIKSIIEQSYQNIELIILDDGSKDSTWQKIQELQVECEKRFVRVVFETKQNEGSCKTLNKLLSLAQGEFVYIIASDDLAKPNAIEKEVEFLANNEDYALVVGDNEIIDSEGKRAYWDNNKALVYEENDAKFLTNVAYLQRGKGFNFNTEMFGTYETIYTANYIPNGYLIRKSIFDIIGEFTPEAPLEDFWLMLQISKYAKMKYIDEVLFSYRWHGSNQMNNIERMYSMTEKTMEYEGYILDTIDSKKVMIDIDKIKEFGVLYKKQGIPFVFELLTYKKLNNKLKLIKLFNMEICRYLKI